MNGNYRNRGLHRARARHTFNLTVTARAIRSALAVSATMLALSGSGLAVAGTCSVNGTGLVSCDGMFTTPGQDSPLVFAVDDLTVILGGNAPSSVDSTGIDGIRLIGAGGSESLTNLGAISTYGGGDANAVDVAAYGDIAIVNSGSLLANVYAYGGSPEDVTAVTAYSATGDISFSNQAGSSITAVADDGDAIAVDFATGQGSIGITNDGDIQANSHGTNATGVSAQANSYGNIYPAYSDVAIANTGSISADIDANSGKVFARGTNSYGHDVSVVNDGDISANADVVLGNSTAVGVQNVADMFSTLVNGADGNISAAATSMQGVYYGADAAAFGAIVVGSIAGITNYGSISSEATGQGGLSIIAATGAQIYSPSGIATIVNSGDINAVATSALTDPVGFANFAYAFAYGTSTSPLFTYYPSAGTTINSGDISARATAFVGAAYSFGATTRGGNAAMYNYEGGIISATSEVESRGRAEAVAVLTTGFEYAHDVNFGTITAYAVAHGIRTSSDERFSYGAANATGVRELAGRYGVSVLSNYGDISATTVALDSIGKFDGGGAATGVYQYGWLYAELSNQGDIRATGSANIGIVSATGVYQQSRYYGSYIGNQAGASISAVASSGSTRGDDSGGAATAYGVRLSDSGQAIVYNSGQISAIATLDPNDRDYFSNPGAAIAVGNYEFGTYGALVRNYGDIEAHADGEFAYATTYGTKLLGFYVAVTYNAGEIVSVANADNGNALATGSYTRSPGQKFANGCSYQGQYGCYAYTYGYAGGTAVLDNPGHLLAQSSASAGTAYAYGAEVIGRISASTSNDGTIVAIANAELGTAHAFGSISDAEYGSASLDNAGSIRAQAFGDNATATGALVIGSYGDVGSGYNAAVVTNSGSITALADGDLASTAVGLQVASRYDDGVSVLNDVGGELVAAAYGQDATATAVSLYSGGINVFTNNGAIAAFGDGLRIAVSSNANAQASIVNNGTLTGSIQTGDHDDTLHNAGVWNAIQQTDFGAGADSIENVIGGAINLHHASILLGGYAESGNVFDNLGTITVSGNDNLIDMGSNQISLQAGPSSNPNAFLNAGLIDFRDGAADDVLTISGDFVGDGELDVDASGLLGISDMLHIQGNVVPGTHNTINIHLLDTPTTASSDIAIVTVSGNSAPANFTLGTVIYTQASFLSLGFSLLSHQDAGNAIDDVYSLGIDVTGLSAPGVLAASVVPGVQNLMNSQVGTWRERMGAIAPSGRGGVSPWARLFQNKGTINPDHTALSLGQGGNFGFDQSNSGSEVGADVGINDELSFGVLAAKSEASQHLNHSGAGASTIRTDTYGVYGTWISPRGFYLDGSYRWMSFTAKMNSVAGGLQVDGDAGTFNLEAGYAWALDQGLKLEPQFQYTQTHVSNVDSATIGSTGFQAHNGSSERVRLGVMLRKSYGDADNGTLWTPYASINAVREFDGNNDYSINDDFFGRTSLQGTSGLFELGATVQRGNLSVHGGLSWQDGGALNGFFGAQLGVRYTFGHGGSSR